MPKSAKKTLLDVLKIYYFEYPCLQSLYTKVLSDVLEDKIYEKNKNLPQEVTSIITLDQSYF